MSDIRLYGIANCDKTRQARRWLEARGIACRFHDYRVEGLDETRLRAWADEFGWSALLNRRGQTWRHLPEEQRARLDAESAIRVMLTTPTLIRRPLLDTGSRRLVGFAADVYAEILC